MSIQKVRAYFEEFDIAGRIREFDVSSATVELAAVAVGVEGARIAKSLSFMVDGQPVIVVAAGCGAKVVASRVGGVPEVLDQAFTVELGEGFADRMAERIASCLAGKPQSIDLSRFDWRRTAREEKSLIDKILADD